MDDGIERKRLQILKVLQNAQRPLSSKAITEELSGDGREISERTVRFHLLATDKSGFTRYIGKKGREITEEGQREISRARVSEKVGFLTAKIDQMTYQMSFDRRRQKGTVVVNVSFLDRDRLTEACDLIADVFAAGYAMGDLLTLFQEGEAVGEMLVPEGHVGIGTVCSITLNGILLAEGIPATSRFGGLLELSGGAPTRFVAIINYDGTTLDPLEIFIKSGMTDYLGATRTGNGQIGAGFREVPAASRERVLTLAEELKPIGLNGFLELGWPGQPLYGVPVDEGVVGAVVIGGLNPVAILEETGMDVHSRALSHLVDYEHLFHYQHLPERAKKLLSAGATPVSRH